MPSLYCQYLGIRKLFTYNAQPCDVASGMLSKRSLTRYVTGGRDFLPLELRWAMAALSASVGWAATTSTPTTFGGVDCCMDRPHELDFTSLGKLYITDIDRAGRAAI